MNDNGNTDSRARIHVPNKIDVNAIRTRLDMTQEELARRFGLSINTPRHWKQGSRQPKGPTHVHLLVLERASKAVQIALRTVA